jgi:hypothetical protein
MALGVMLSLSTLAGHQAERNCYRLDKVAFEETLDRPEDLLVRLGSLPEMKGDETVEVQVRFDTARFIPYVDGAELSCVRTDASESAGGRESPRSYQCDGDDDGGHMRIERRGDGWYFLLEYTRMSVTTDDPFVHSVRSKRKRFLKGVPAPCYRKLQTRFAYRNVSEDPVIARLMHSLSRHSEDVIVNDLAVRGEIAVAVGLDNSIRTRMLQERDEYMPGVILSSRDGGRSWQRIFFEDVPFDRVWVDDGVALALGTLEGAGGYLYRSVDGGEHWEQVYRGGYLNALVRFGAFYYAGGYRLLRSRDGRRWEEVPARLGEEIRALFVPEGGEKLVLVSERGIYIGLPEKGEWRLGVLPEEASEIPLSPVLYQQEGRLYLVDRYPHGMGFVSADGGAHWQQLAASDEPEGEEERSSIR